MAAEGPGGGAGAGIEPGRRRAQLFCGRCGYPFFWGAPPPSPRSGGDDTSDLGLGPRSPDGEDDDAGDLVLRRRPGAAGIRLPATVPCPACRELNLVMELICVRCGSAMHPEPEPEPEPVVLPEPPPPPGPAIELTPW